MRNFIATLLFVTLTQFSFGQEKTVLTASQFNDSIHLKPDAILLDVRTPAEYSKGFIGNAKNLDYNGEEFKTLITKMDKNKPYFVYCMSGGRSSAAINEMQEAGFKNIYELKGGILAWKGEKLPMTELSEVADKISRAQYENLISEGKVLVDFYAPWCGPCVKMEPMLKSITKEYKGKVTIVRINIDENKQLADLLGIYEIPLFKLYNNNKKIWEYSGYISKKDLKKELDQ